MNCIIENVRSAGLPSRSRRPVSCRSSVVRMLGKCPDSFLCFLMYQKVPPGAPFSPVILLTTNTYQNFNLLLLTYLKIRPGPRPFVKFRNKIIFYGEALLATLSTPKLEDNPLLAVHDCLFNIFAATLHIWRP
jgi:hypothetical protein